MCLIGIGLICASGECLGDANSTSAPTSQAVKASFENDDFEVSIGIANTIRLGKWVPVAITPKRSQKITQVNIQARDGADAPVTYEFKQLSPLADGSVETLVRFGRKRQSFQLSITTEDGSTAQLTVPLTDTNILLSVNPMILAIEQDAQITQAVNGEQGLLASDSRPAAKQIADVTLLPNSWLAYDAVDTIFLTTNNSGILSQLSNQQLKAIEQWSRQGGRLIVSASPAHAADWFAAERPLARFAPSPVKNTLQFSNSSRLEKFAGSRVQMIKTGAPPIDIVDVETGQAKVWVADENRHPLIVQHPLGLGSVVFVAFDLKHPNVLAWKNYPELIRVLNAGPQSSNRDGKSISSLGSGGGHLGFADIVGQLFAPMEQFSKVQFVPFTAIAILIGLYILCIGPLDYFLLRKLFKRMELTWITFPLFSLLFCGLAIGISQWSRPHTLQVNQLEIIDIDASDSICRGLVWTNFYSPTGDALDIQLSGTNSLDLNSQQRLTSWHGLPGDGLGGMNGGSAATVSTPRYTHSVSLNPATSQLISFPIPVSSSRAVFSNWQAEMPSKIRSNLTFRKKTDEIVGNFKNPLNCELTNCRLYHGNWAYVLEAPLGGGDVIDIATETNSKRIQSILNRKRVDAEDSNRTYATRWDLSDMNVGRIAEMMMFYELAGGRNYTGLSHGYQGKTDMSSLLTSQRAILIGEIKGQVSQLDATTANPSAAGAPEYDQVTTFVRIVLPVNAQR